MSSNTTPNYLIPTLVINESNPTVSVYPLTPAYDISWHYYLINNWNKQFKAN
jgi:hypothetical protein